MELTIERARSAVEAVLEEVDLRKYVRYQEDLTERSMTNDLRLLFITELKSALLRRDTTKESENWAHDLTGQECLVLMRRAIKFLNAPAEESEDEELRKAFNITQGGGN